VQRAAAAAGGTESDQQRPLRPEYALSPALPGKRLIIGGEVNAQGGRQFLRLSFTDYGIGIAPGIQERIFDPFFSTKPKGEGTGLGLSISHGLVRDHGGFIRVRSKVGEWTQFQIDLPVHPDGETT
jgi:signal transduction histidine kinase